MLIKSQKEFNYTRIRYPKRSGLTIKNDYFHRVSSIFIHISFDKWIEQIEANEKKYLIYYDNNPYQSKAKFEAETHLDLGQEQHYTLDIICGFIDTKKQSHSFCIEVFNNNKVAYIKRQLVLLFGILERSQKIEQRINMKAIPRILVTFDNEQTMKRVIDSLQNHPVFQVEEIGKLIFFNLDSRVWKQFENGWVNLYREPVDLLNCSLEE